MDRWAILSPLTCYRTLCKWVARSTLDDRFEVSRRSLEYRRGVIQWMRARHAAGGAGSPTTRSIRHPWPSIPSP